MTGKLVIMHISTKFENIVLDLHLTRDMENTSATMLKSLPE